MFKMGRKKLLALSFDNPKQGKIKPRLTRIMQTRLWRDINFDCPIGLIAKYAPDQYGDYKLFERRIENGEMVDTALNFSAKAKTWPLEDVVKRMATFENAMLETVGESLHPEDENSHDITSIHYNPSHYFMRALALNEHLALCQDSLQLHPIVDGVPMDQGRWSPAALRYIQQAQSHIHEAHLPYNIEQKDVLDEAGLNKYLDWVRSDNNDRRIAHAVNYLLNHYSNVLASVETSISNLAFPRLFDFDLYRSLKPSHTTMPIDAESFLHTLGTRDDYLGAQASLAYHFDRLINNNFLFCLEQSGDELSGYKKPSHIEYLAHELGKKRKPFDAATFKNILNNSGLDDLVQNRKNEVGHHISLHIAIELARSLARMQKLNPDYTLNVSEAGWPRDASSMDYDNTYEGGAYPTNYSSRGKLALNLKSNAMRIKAHDIQAEIEDIKNEQEITKAVDYALSFYITMARFERYPIISDAIWRSTSNNSQYQAGVTEWLKTNHAHYYDLHPKKFNFVQTSGNINYAEFYKHLCKEIIQACKKMGLDELQINAIANAIANPDTEYKTDFSALRQRISNTGQKIIDSRNRIIEDLRIYRAENLTTPRPSRH